MTRTDRLAGASAAFPRIIGALLVAVAMALAAGRPAFAAVEIQEVKGESGITSWLVEDYSVPIIAIRFAFEGGSTQDPAGKEGLASLMSGLFDEGAGDLDADAFQIRLDDAGAEMSFTASADAIYGQMRLLAETRDEAFSLLRMALQRPRFDAEPVDRIRGQLVSRIRSQERDPRRLGDIAWSEALYRGHPYARRSEGTIESLNAVTPDDLKLAHEKLFARSNLKIGVVGAIDAATLKTVIDDLFSGLPETAQLVPVERVDAKLAQEVKVDFPTPQTTIQFAYPGVERNDPRFFAAYLMNQVLGGGSFSSRLFEEVREKRGLSYGVSSGLANREYTSSLIIGTSTRSDRAADTLQVIRDVVARMASEGPTQEELDKAKRYVVGAYAIANLDNSSSIARTLVEIQLDDLGIDYIDRRVDLINGVTLEAVKAEASRLLATDPAVLTVGPAASGN